MGIDELRDALKGLNAALEGQAAEGAQTLSVRALAAEAVKALGGEGLRELVGLLADALADKQDTLTEGAGISISEENVISCALDLSGYAKTSDLSGYVTTSSLSSQLAGYLPLSGGTLTGDLKAGGTTVRASDGHIVLPSGVEIY